MRIAAVFLLLAGTAAAQTAGFGIKAGVGDRAGIQTPPLTSRVRRFTVGPVLEVGLPLGLGVEFDALWKRYDQAGASVAGGVVRKTGSSWEFPLLAKYRLGSGPARPYVEAGVSFSRFGGLLVPFRSLPAPPPVQPEESAWRTGVVAGAGVELALPRMRVVPGIRYSRWRARESWPFLPGSGSADLLVGIVF